MADDSTIDDAGAVSRMTRLTVEERMVWRSVVLDEAVKAWVVTTAGMGILPRNIKTYRSDFRGFRYVLGVADSPRLVGIGGSVKNEASSAVLFIKVDAETLHSIEDFSLLRSLVTAVRQRISGVDAAYRSLFED